MKLKLPVLWGAALALLALVALLGIADSAQAATTFNPELAVCFDDEKTVDPHPTQAGDAEECDGDNSPEAHSAFTVNFDVPKGDVNFAAVISFIPKDWGITPGTDLPIGAVVGTLSSQATLGLFNQPCNNPLPVDFTMLNSSIDTSVTVPYNDSDDSGKGDVYEDKDKNGLRDFVDKYPDFINRILKDADGKPLQPIRRAAGYSAPAGVDVLLQFLIFAPGTVINEALDHDPNLGYPSMTLLLNIGDPDVVPAPGPITDFCTPLLSTNTSFGITQDNPDTKDVDESGKVSLTNPQDGKYTFTTIALGQRDADGDGIEQSLDTCPFDVNEGDPRVLNSGDTKGNGNGLDDACNTATPPCDVSDCDNDGYSNRGDNCPLVANGVDDSENQKDSDSDGIGDICDKVGAGGIGKGPTTADGDYSLAQPTAPITVGSGTGPGGPPKSTGGGGDGGSDTTLIIIIVVIVVAAVVVVGGGAALWMRRRRA